MERIDNIQQYKIYANAVKDEATGSWVILQDEVESNQLNRGPNPGPNNNLPKGDFVLPIFLRRTYEVYEYVDVAKEEEIMPIERQEFNPYFIEFGFFDTINRNRVNNGGELTLSMINLIKIRRPDVANLNTNELKKWYDDIGKNEFPWNKGTATETTVNDIDRASFVSGHIISKAKHFNIDINR